MMFLAVVVEEIDKARRRKNPNGWGEGDASLLVPRTRFHLHISTSKLLKSVRVATIS